MSQLVAKHLQKRYGQRAAVADISISVSRGEIIGLLGPNGAGKTTSFYMIVGLIKADGGVIELDGKPITEKPMHERARLGVGYLPQEASVFRKLTAADNILAILELRRGMSKATPCSMRMSLPTA